MAGIMDERDLMINQLDIRITNLAAKFDELAKRQSEDHEELVGKIHNSGKQIRELQHDVRINNFTLVQHTALIHGNKTALASLEDDLKSREISIEGLAETTQMSPINQAMELLNRLVPNFPIEAIEDARRKGYLQKNQVQGRRPRQLIVILRKQSDRDLILSRKRELIKFDKTIWLHPNESTSSRASRDLVSSICKAAKLSNIDAIPKGTKLLYKGQRLSPDEITKLPPALFYAAVKTNVQKNFVCYKSDLSPLSNLYPAKLVDQGVLFSCAEQHYQFSKSLFHDETELAKSIMQLHDPYAMKSKTARLRSTDWVVQQTAYLKQSCILKFEQNPNLHNFLIDTEERVLIEATPDPLFGGKLPLYPRLDKKDSVPKLAGTNAAGVILMEIRREIRGKGRMKLGDNDFRFPSLENGNVIEENRKQQTLGLQKPTLNAGAVKIDNGKNVNNIVEHDEDRIPLKEKNPLDEDVLHLGNISNGGVLVPIVPMLPHEPATVVQAHGDVTLAAIFTRDNQIILKPPTITDTVIRPTSPEPTNEDVLDLSSSNTTEKVSDGRVYEFLNLPGVLESEASAETTDPDEFVSSQKVASQTYRKTPRKTRKRTSKLAVRVGEVLELKR